MRTLLALTSAVVGAAAASNWESLLSIFGAAKPSGRDIGALDLIVDKLAQRIASAQPHASPSVVVLPASSSIATASYWASTLPFGLIAASTFVISRYFGLGVNSFSTIAQTSVAAAVEHLRCAVSCINGNVDELRRHADLRFDSLQQLCDSGFDRVSSDIEQLKAQVSGVQILQQRQLDSNARLEESVSALLHAANGIRADARDSFRPLDIQALIGGHAARYDPLSQVRIGALLRA